MMKLRIKYFNKIIINYDDEIKKASSSIFMFITYKLNETFIGKYIITHIYTQFLSEYFI